MSAAVFPHQNL